MHCLPDFGKYFTDRTIIVEPLLEELSGEEKKNILIKRKEVMDKVKEYIDLYIDPKRNNIIQKNKSIEEILEQLNIKNKIMNTHSISSESGFRIHFKRSPNSCFINKYFADGLLAWEANVDYSNST